MPTKRRSGAPTSPQSSKYSKILDLEVSGSLQLEVVKNDVQAAKMLANALKEHPSSEFPTKVPSLNNALQGNLAEFLAWELGEQHWLLFDRAWSWAPNAENPWKPSSDPGIDILAILSPNNKPMLLVFEVKSSIGDGVGLINGSSSSLQTDFKSLFEGKIQGRLASRVGRILSNLKYHKGRPDLIDPVKKLIGKGPSASPGVKLTGLLICSQGENHSESTKKRKSAFEALTQELKSSGWIQHQLDMRCIETPSFGDLLTRAISEVLNGRK